MKYIEKITSHLAFTRGEQYGILLLSLFIVAVQVLKWTWKAAPSPIIQFDSEEIRAWQKELDSLERLALKASKPKLYPFNPNFISDYKGYMLGLSPEAMDCLFAFRDSGKWVRSASEFQKVTGVSDTWLDSIAPYFKFPKFSNGRKIYPSNYRGYSPPTVKSDLNSATVSDLKKVPGIGDVFATRIVRFREQLGGFSGEAQLYAVYGLKENVVPRVFDYFTIKTPVKIVKKNINGLSASDIATLPGISFDLAVKIWEQVRKENGIESLDELRKIDEITPQKIALIQLYLSAEP